MYISHLTLKNWKNFRSANVDLSERIFLVGPNASGKSNFLDVFRFLHDLAKQGGGLQKSVSTRGGISKIRCLSARQNPEIEILVVIQDDSEKVAWRYEIGIEQERSGLHLPKLSYERVYRNDQNILSRPDDSDKQDPPRLTQTHLEQINSNKEFRLIAKFFESIFYLHLVPQLLKHPEAFKGPGVPEDPYGKDFLERIASTPEKIRTFRLNKIESVLRVAVPQLKGLNYTKDVRGTPHLEAIYEHWRPNAGKQKEDQFSDGTLRLIALMWALLESDALLLLEEPELSLNAGIIRQLAPLMYRLQQMKKRQLIISTHSSDLLYDEGIGVDEVLLLTPINEGTSVTNASDIDEIKDLLEHGMNLADAILPRTNPAKIHQLEFNF